MIPHLVVTFWPGSNHVVRLLHGNHSFQQRRSPGASAQQVCNSFMSKLSKYLKKKILPKIYLFRKIISLTINQILSKNGPVHKSWLSLEWPGSLLDCRQPTVRLPENPQIWFLEKPQNLISSAFRHITADPESNPGWYYLKWVVSGTVGGSNGGETKIQSYTSC